MRRFSKVVVFLAALALVSGCQQASQPGDKMPADTPAAERGAGDSQPKSQPSEGQPPPLGAAESAAPGKLAGREYVPPDALFVSAVFPSRTLARPELAGAPIERVLRKIGYLDRPLEMPVPARFLAELGVPLQDVEQVVCVVTGVRNAGHARPGVSPGTPRAPAQPVGNPEEPVPVTPRVLGPEQDSWLYGPLMAAYVVRLAEPAPRAAVDLLFRPKKVVLGGKTYFGQGEDTGVPAVHFADERTMIFGEERVVRKMLAEEKGPSALGEALDDLDLEADIVGILNVAAVREKLMPRAATGAAPKSPIDDVGVASFAVRLDPRPSANVVVHVQDAAAGDRVKEVLQSAIAAAREEVAAMRPSHGQPEVQEVRELARDLFTRGVKALEFERVEDRVEITLEDFAPLGDLTTLLSRFSTTALGRVDVPLPAVPLFEEDTAAATIRRLIPAAAGSRADVLHAIAQSPTTPKPSDLLVDSALSSIVLMYKVHPPGVYEANAEEFCFESPTTPKPSGLVRELFRSKYLGYYSMIHADRITDFTCDVDGETAKGSVSFKAPGQWQGKVRYAAERADGRWRIKEFQMPIHRWRFVRTEAGRWKWLTVFGDAEELSRRFGRPTGGEPVSGKITLDGEPLSSGLIQFSHTADTFAQPLGHVRDGTYSLELPAGSYHVVVLTSQPKVPKKYCRLGQSGLMIEVVEGENAFDFNLANE